jgi:hypothetical protein
MRRCTLLLVMAMVVTGVSAPGMASASSSADPCGIVGINYTPTEVMPGQEMSATLSIRNCSSERLTMLVKTRADGPCVFPYPPDSVHEINAGVAVLYYLQFPAPACAGSYEVRVQLWVPDVMLDRDLSRFTVSAI